MSDFTDRFGGGGAIDDILGSQRTSTPENEYRAFDTSSNKTQLGCLIEHKEGIEIYRFSHMLHSNYTRLNERDIITLGGGGLIVQLRLKNFQTFEIQRFLKALNNQEVTHIREFITKTHEKSEASPFIENIKISRG